MGVQTIQLGAALLSGGFLPTAAGWLWRRLRRDPKTDAEARKITAEADDLIVGRLYAEIQRLDRELGELRQQLSDERKDCDRRIQQMEGRIRQLQQRQMSAGNMASNQAEGPLRTAYPVIDAPDQDSDLIRKLDRKTAKGPKR